MANARQREKGICLARWSVLVYFCLVHSEQSLPSLFSLPPIFGRRRGVGEMLDRERKQYRWWRGAGEKLDGERQKAVWRMHGSRIQERSR